MNYKYYCLTFSNDRIDEIYRVHLNGLKYEAFYTGINAWHEGKHVSFIEKIATAPKDSVKPIDFNKEYLFKSDSIKEVFRALKIGQTKLGIEIL